MFTLQTSKTRKPAGRRSTGRPKKKGKAARPPARRATTYAQKKLREAARSRAASLVGRDIAKTYPASGDEESWKACQFDYKLYCETYHAGWFYNAWSTDHLDVIADIQDVVLNGGLKAIAMPRGSGKSALCLAAVLWCLLYAHRQFVSVIGATEPHGEKILHNFKYTLSTNDLLLRDFREICHPIRCLENNSKRCIGQIFQGQMTSIDWSSKQVILPMMPAEALEEWKTVNPSGAIVSVRGITGALRGQQHTLKGRIIRPQLVLLDDPQDRESAYSASQSEQRIAIVNGDVLGMAGPGESIAALMPCTVIRPGDMADVMLNRKKHPAWQGTRTKMLKEMPKRQDLWEAYWRLRADSFAGGGKGEPATEFYRDNQQAMDEGAVVPWPSRKEKADLSALQTAMNLFFRDPAAFAAEYQNEPLPEQDQVEALTADQVLDKASGVARGMVPVSATHLVGHVDVQGDSLWWSVYSSDDAFNPQLVDRGIWPPQIDGAPAHLDSIYRQADLRVTLVNYYKSKGKRLGMMGAIVQGLTDLADYLEERTWLAENSTPVKLERAAVDSRWGDSNKHVRTWARLRGGIWITSIGLGIGASGVPMGDWKLQQGERRGDHWLIRRDAQGQELRADVNHWKSFAETGIRTGRGDRGAMMLYGQPIDHHGLASHFTSEYPVPVEGRGRTVNEWKRRPDKPDNHWWDNYVMCCVLLSVVGCSITGQAAPAPRRRVRFSEMQRRGGYVGRGN